MTLKDATDSIHIVIYNYCASNDTLYIGKLVKIKFTRIISEWSLVHGKSWETTYLVIDYQDIVAINYKASEATNKASNLDNIVKYQEWKVLYRSQPTFKSSNEHPSVYVAVRKTIERKHLVDDPQYQFDIDSCNNPVRFIELPLEELPSAVFVTPGTTFKIKAQIREEKFLSILQIHVKRLLKLNPSIPSTR